MLDKHYDPREVEKRWYQEWESRGLFASKVDPEREPFSVVIPPPNVTGILHMGHVLNNTIQDIICRYKRMKGYNVCWVPGTDHAGIATQNMVEKSLRKEGIDPDQLSREDFLDRVWDWKEKFGGIIIQQLRQLGCSCDWERERFTMEPKLSNAVLETFVRLYEKGMIYRDKYIVNWCPALQTALSDDEVERDQVASSLWHFRYPLSDGSGHLVVATTRPETMLGDTGVAVNPNDERYRHLIGKSVTLPIVGRKIPIFPDDHVDLNFGTGCVKVTPAHDLDDFEMGKTHNLDFVVIMDKTAHMNHNVPEAFRGMYRDECRKAVVAKMGELGLLEKVEPHTVSVGRCYRTKDIIEPYLSDQWFIKMKDMAMRALEPVESGEIKFHPERWVNTYRHWMNNIRDWCISRQLKWGHRIPVWICQDCDGETCSVEEAATCRHCQSERIVQDPDVLDTWASSWLWPFSVFNWPENNADLNYYYPTNTLVTAADIIFFWVARMIMAGQEFMGKIPFSTVYFNGVVRDMEGRKMSKTLGNSPDPLDIIANYGADALRFTIVYQTPYGQDARFAAESCDLGRGFCTKIWNANRFLQMTFEGIEADPHWQEKPQDLFGRWMLSRLSTTIQEVSDDLENHQYASAASRIYNFFWGEFCDWYVEFIKPVVKQAGDEEKSVILGRTQHILDMCLRMLHPFMPHVTEELWQKLAEREDGAMLMSQAWPQVNPSHVDTDIESSLASLRELITGIRSVRKTYNLSRHTPLKLELYIENGNTTIIDEARPVIFNMVGLSALSYTQESLAPTGSVALALSGMNAYLDLRGLVDTATEIAKIDQKLAKLDKEIKALEGRLNNPNFAARAKPDIVEKARESYEEQLRQKETLVQSRVDFETLSNA